MENRTRKLKKIIISLRGGEEEESLSNALIFANESVTEGKAQSSQIV